jgi:hypothetical protein
MGIAVTESHPCLSAAAIDQRKSIAPSGINQAARTTSLQKTAVSRSACIGPMATFRAADAGPPVKDAGFCA